MTDTKQYSSRGNKLYKLPDKAKVCGVCAGLAEYLGFEIWVVRIITISLLLLSWFSGTVVLAYIIMCFVLEPKPGSKSTKGVFGKKKYRNSEERSYDDRPYQSSVKEVWQSGNSPSATLHDVEDKFANIESKLQNLESFVTSSRFNLEKEFNRMRD